MSFSSEVKKELALQYSGSRHCDIAEIAGVISTCGIISPPPSASDSKPAFSVKVQTENVIVAKKYFKLIKSTFNISSEISVQKNTQLKKSRLYSIYISGAEISKKLLNATGFLTENNHLLKSIDPLVVKRECCKRAYIRGAFISGGSISDPEKAYHLEFVYEQYEQALRLLEMINYFGLKSKIIERKSHFVVYLKEGEQVVDLLNIMTAHKALMDLENLRIIKDMRNNVNRIVNCETANLKKTVNAAILQIENIHFIEKLKGLNFLSEQLEEVAKLRLLNPDASLKEIGAMLTPTVGKSGVNHRLRKISEIAEKLRGDSLW